MSSRRLLVNSAANLIGRAGGSVINVLAVPLYVRWLGAESFGVVAFVVSLQASLAILDLGLAMTMNREVARLEGKNPILVGNTLSTLARVYGITALTVFCVLAAGAPWLVDHWLHLKSLDPEEIKLCLVLAAAGIALRWPVAVYSGVIQGAQKQVLANSISGGMGLGRAAGGLAALAFVDARLEVFFTWQVIAAVIELVLTRYFAWKSLPPESYRLGQFDWAVLAGVWRFAAGFGLVAAVGTLVANLDRLLVARLLPLENLGLLAMLSTAAGVITLCGSAVSTAVFPQFVKAGQAIDRETQLGIELKRSLRLIAAVVVPGLLVFVFFTPSLLIVWTGNGQLPTDGVVTLRLLALGAAINAIGSPFYIIVIAHGPVRWLLAANLASLLLLIPLYWFGLPLIGIALAAVGWCLLNTILVFSSILCCRNLVMMPRLSPKEVIYLFATPSLFAVVANLTDHINIGHWTKLGLACGLAGVSLLSVEEVRQEISARISLV